MGKRGAPRTLIALRLSDAGIAAIDQLALDAGLMHNGKPNRSEMARRLLAAAITDLRIRQAVTKPR